MTPLNAAQRHAEGYATFRELCTVAERRGLTVALHGTTGLRLLAVVEPRTSVEVAAVTICGRHVYDAARDLLARLEGRAR